MYRNELKKNDIDPKFNDLIFQSFDWYHCDIQRQTSAISLDENPDEEDKTDNDDNIPEYCVKSFGVDAIGKSVALTIFDYKPSFLVHFKDIDVSDLKTFKLLKSRIMDELSVPYKCHILDVSLVNKINLYGFSNFKQLPFLQLSFPNLKSFKYASYNFKSIRFRSREHSVQQFESNLEPHLRMLHMLNVQPSGWIKVPATKYRFNDEHLLSNTTLDLETSWDCILPHSSNSIAPMVIASYDIECTSSHGDFPQAIKSYNKTARELNEYYKSLTQNKKTFHTKKEVKEKIQYQLLSLFNIENDMNMEDEKLILTYVIPKNSNFDKQNIKFAVENHTYDLIHLMKDKPKSEKLISEFILRDLKIDDPKACIDKLKKIHEKLSKFGVNEIKIRQGIAAEIMKFNKNFDQYKFQLKVSNNIECIMGLFDKSTIFDKISEKFVKMGFPALEGDPIIQIGTTFHIYGETECFFKNIITLDSVEDIEDADEIIECKKERDIILQWRDMIHRMDPDIITGYNIFGFDNGYIYDRARELKIITKIQNMGRLCDFKFDKWNPSFIVKELQSSALGQNILKYFNMHGRVQIDLMKLVQKDHKLDSYKLDTVASTFITGKVTKVIDHSNIVIDNTHAVHVGHFLKIGANKFKITNLIHETNQISIDNDDHIDIEPKDKWGLIKDDVSPNEIFKCQQGSPADRAKIAKYCIQDCALCNFLMMKLEVVANNIGMSNVCLVPLSYIFLRGQGIKIFSLVAKQCLDDGFAIPVIRKADEDSDESYEGAIVLTPTPGIYTEPIAVLDFASLYPSSMISENISHDSIVTDEKYNNLPGIDYVDIKYDVNGEEVSVRFAQFEKLGVMPRILKKLLKQRKTTRKKIGYKKVTTIDNRSLSGILADKGTCVELTDLDTNNVTTIERDQISSTQDSFNEFDKAVLDGLQLAYKITANSLYGQVGARTSPICYKELAASTTATGRNLVLKLKDFAEDNYDCKVVYGDSVMPYTPILLKKHQQVFVKEIQDVQSECNGWGSYDGFLKTGSDKQKLDVDDDDDMYTWTHKGWQKVIRIIRHKTKKRIYRITTGASVVDVTEDHSLLSNILEPIKPESLTLGTELKHSPQDVHDLIFETEFVKHAFEFDVYQRQIECENQYKAQVAFIYFAFLGLHCFKIEEIGGKFILHLSRERNIDSSKHPNQRAAFTEVQQLRSISMPEKNDFSHDALSQLRDASSINQVKKIELLHQCYEDFVYDIETKVGTFQAGIGNMIVKNTDSIFIKYNSLKDENGAEFAGKERIQAAINTSIEMSNAFKPLLKPPHDAEFEKVYSPWIVLSKKRYTGNLYEDDVNKFYQKSMGIVLTRRDNCSILKRVYGGMIDIILNQSDIGKAISYLKNQLTLIQNGSVSINDLIISKTLKGSYANPQQIAHKVLSDRMAERDAGSAPNINDRVQYVYICNPDKSALQGDRIESPDFIKTHNLQIDYGHYISNQILKPSCQLLALAVEQIPGYRRPDGYFTQLLEKYKKKYGDDKIASEKVQTEKEKIVENLLFEPVLANIRKKLKNQRSISDFF